VPPTFHVSGISFTPPLIDPVTNQGTTFVQSQPGQPLGTPCSLFPNLPTSVTATATVVGVNGQVPDAVLVEIDSDHAFTFPMTPTSPGSSTYTATGSVTDGHETFPRNPMSFMAHVDIVYQGVTSQFGPPDPALLIPCA
jgi:hypothetical protein